MPTYEYQCPECGPFDKVVSLSDYDDMKYVTCRCGGQAKRVLSTPTFTLSWAPSNPYDNPKLDPWRGTALEGGGGPDELNYESEKIFVDHGVVTKQGGETRPRKDWLSKMPEGVGT